MYIECVLLVVKGFVDFSVFVKKLIEENLKGWTVESIKIMWYVFLKITITIISILSPSPIISIFIYCSSCMHVDYEEKV